MTQKHSSGAVVDGVHRFPQNGIKVIIIGAGVGGLGAALECWRKGCDVVILERADQLSPLGDFFTITPSALTTLKHYPSMWKDYHESVHDCTVHVCTPSGKILTSQLPEWRCEGAKHSAPGVQISFLKRRPVFAKMQLDQVNRLNIPVHFGQKVLNVEEGESRVVVHTVSGEQYEGDVCIAANGIGSKIKGLETSTSDVQVQDSGYAIARIAFPADMIMEGSPAASLLKNIAIRPRFRVYLAEDVHLILFLTKDWVALAFTHRNDGSATESWNNLQDPETLLIYLNKAGVDWDPAVIDFLKQTPGKIVDWNLRWRDNTEQWTSDGGRIVTLGDAAHAFLPTAGNGANQALEDGISLGECLRIGGKRNAHWATKVHNKLRFQRTSILQQTGFLNREELHTADISDLEKNSGKSDIGFFKHGRWQWAHDAEKYARENFTACLDSLRGGNVFRNTNLPPGHVYEPWSLRSEKERMEKGIRSSLKRNGYWGVEKAQFDGTAFVCALAYLS